MSEPAGQQPSPAKRARSARSTKATAKKSVEAPANKAAVQPGAPSEASSQSQTKDALVGEKWGEFPPAERQAELIRILEAWDSRIRPGPFAGFNLSGADVYWLAALVAGEGDVEVGKKGLDQQRALPTLYDRLSDLHLEGAYLFGAHLEGARLGKTHLEGATLFEAHLEGTTLFEAHLEGTDLSRTHLEGVDLRKARLTNHTDLREATLDVKTQLAEARLDATFQVADVAWNSVSLIRVDWRQVPRLGDEAVARQAKTSLGRPKNTSTWLEGFETAARAYRQLAVVLRGQGITDVADRFTYRALIMQRKALWWQLRNRRFRALGAYLFALFLEVLTGYGFRLWRIIAAYTFLILAFAGAYWSLDLQTPHIYTFWQALILSVTAFHGRVFSNPFLLTEPQIVVTAIEAIFGLVIEGVFIAMLTQRFFNR